MSQLMLPPPLHAAICHGAADGTLAVSGLVGAGTGEVQLWREQARACWALPGHPGWGLLQVSVEEFEAGLPPSSGATMLLPAELAVPCRQEVMARLIHMPPPDQLLEQAPPPVAAGACAPPAGAGGTTAAQAAAAAAEQRAPPSPAQQVLETAAPAPAGPEGYAAAAAAGAGGGPGEQEPPASPYETAMRLPSLPLLGDMFPSLPKAGQGRARQELQGRCLHVVLHVGSRVCQLLEVTHTQPGPCVAPALPYLPLLRRHRRSWRQWRACRTCCRATPPCCPCCLLWPPTGLRPCVAAAAGAAEATTCMLCSWRVSASSRRRSRRRCPRCCCSFSPAWSSSSGGRAADSRRSGRAGARRRCVGRAAAGLVWGSSPRGSRAASLGRR